MTDATFTAADMRAAWEAGRDAAADRMQRLCDNTPSYIPLRDIREHVVAAIRALTPPTAALAKGQSHD